MLGIPIFDPEKRTSSVMVLGISCVAVNETVNADRGFRVVVRDGN